MELYFCYAHQCDLTDHDSRDSPGPRRHSKVLHAIKPQWWRQRQAGEDVGATYTYPKPDRQRKQCQRIIQTQQDA